MGWRGDHCARRRSAHQPNRDRQRTPADCARLCQRAGPRGPRRCPPRAVETEAETQRLAAQVRELAADRERLTARIATARAQSRGHDRLDQTAERATGRRPCRQYARRRRARPPPRRRSLPRPAAAAPRAGLDARWRCRRSPTPPRPGPRHAAASSSGETATEPVPLPPVRVAAAPASEPAAEPPRKPEFGIDLGGAASMRSAAHPLGGGEGQLRAAAGGAASARRATPEAPGRRHVIGWWWGRCRMPPPRRKLCARFAATRTGCRPAKFDGVQLAAH